MNHSDEWIVQSKIPYLTIVDPKNELFHYTHLRRGSVPSLHNQVLSQATESKALLQLLRYVYYRPIWE